MKKLKNFQKLYIIIKLLIIKKSLHHTHYTDYQGAMKKYVITILQLDI